MASQYSGLDLAPTYTMRSVCLFIIIFTFFTADLSPVAAIPMHAKSEIQKNFPENDIYYKDPSGFIDKFFDIFTYMQGSALFLLNLKRTKEKLPTTGFFRQRLIAFQILRAELTYDEALYALRAGDLQRAIEANSRLFSLSIKISRQLSKHPNLPALTHQFILPSLHPLTSLEYFFRHYPYSNEPRPSKIRNCSRLVRSLFTGKSFPSF